MAPRCLPTSRRTFRPPGLNTHSRCRRSRSCKRSARNESVHALSDVSTIVSRRCWCMMLARSLRVTNRSTQFSVHHSPPFFSASARRAPLAHHASSRSSRASQSASGWSRTRPRLMSRQNVCINSRCQKIDTDPGVSSPIINLRTRHSRAGR